MHWNICSVITPEEFKGMIDDLQTHCDVIFPNECRRVSSLPISISVNLPLGEDELRLVKSFEEYIDYILPRNSLKLKEVLKSNIFSFFRVCLTNDSEIEYNLLNTVYYIYTTELIRNIGKGDIYLLRELTDRFYNPQYGDWNQNLLSIATHEYTDNVELLALLDVVQKKLYSKLSKHISTYLHRAIIDSELFEPTVIDMLDYCRVLRVVVEELLANGNTLKMADLNASIGEEYSLHDFERMTDILEYEIHKLRHYTTLAYHRGGRVTSNGYILLMVDEKLHTQKTNNPIRPFDHVLTLYLKGFEVSTNGRN